MQTTCDVAETHKVVLMGHMAFLAMEVAKEKDQIMRASRTRQWVRKRQSLVVNQDGNRIAKAKRANQTLSEKRELGWWHMLPSHHKVFRRCHKMLFIEPKTGGILFEGIFDYPG